MAWYVCIECVGAVEIDVSHIGQWAARGLIEPARVLCFPCVKKLNLVGHRDGPCVWVLYHGQEFRPYQIL